MLLNYDIENGTHRDAEEEWPLHTSTAANAIEWHYYTGNLTGDNGHRYFIFLCLHNAFGTSRLPSKLPEGNSMLLCTFIFKDYDEGTFGQSVIPLMRNPDGVYEEGENAVRICTDDGVERLYFQYKGDEVVLRSSNDAFECDLKCTGGNRVLWMKDSLGYDGLIREGGESDRSFYYSLPELPTTGTVKYTDRNGNAQTVRMTGEGWVDRQWGDFDTKSWDWMSFRMLNGDRINTYTFANGYQVGVHQDKDGNRTCLGQFEVTPTGYCYSPMQKLQISCGWEYDIPVLGECYRIVPLSDDTFSESPQNTFFEGLCKVYDKSGEMVGWSIAESMSTEIMHNAPEDIALRKQARL